MLDLNNAIRKEKNSYIFLCSECGAEIKSKDYYLNKHSGKCRSCVVKKPAFYHVFNRLKNTAKNEDKPISISFEDFLEFTKQNFCYYCLHTIPWKPYAYSKNKYVSGGYFLDRKDNTKGYCKDNLVVYCSRCNYAKGNRFSFEEWYGMTKYFRELTKF